MFPTQQVAEKYFKAFLLAKGRTYPRLHKVVELAALCGEMQKDLWNPSVPIPQLQPGEQSPTACQ
jgi:HEPN domain-containing protein